ncbi:hypothetical protein Prudu_008008 [Prunus dulcis]|uniref:Uncharacterized protein n=1 Tax=Prunus dulcis TaxID=3755 RepID=A0A4Y1R3E0_PRUDU|nr:hypothetical protein Prudu_008008 [Prunus dulcis]
MGKDKQTHRILYKGQSDKGLYPIPQVHPQPSQIHKSPLHSSISVIANKMQPTIKPCLYFQQHKGIQDLMHSWVNKSKPSCGIFVWAIPPMMFFITC